MENEEGQVSHDLPVLTRKAIMDFLLKYECPANEFLTQTFEQVNRCISESKDLLQYAMKMLHHLIRNNSEVIGQKQPKEDEVMVG